MNKFLKRIGTLMLVGVMTVAFSTTAYADVSGGNGSAYNGSGYVANPTYAAPVTSAVFGKAVAAAAKGDSVFTTIQTGEVVKADVWKAARENATRVVLRSGTTTWTFGEITNDVDFDPTIYTSNQLPAAAAEAITAAVTKAGVKDYVPVSFAYDGNLPGTAEVTIDLSSTGKFYGGQIVYMYYLNPATGNFEFVDSAEYFSSATFTMTHCSEYIITGEKLAGTAIRTSAKTGEVVNATLYTVMLLSALGMIAVVAKRKANR